MTAFEVNDQGGGVSAGGEDISRVQAMGPGGAELTIRRPDPHRVVVEHAPSSAIELSYAFLSNDYQVQDDRSQFRRPVLNRGLFRTVGHLGLLLPSHDSTKQNK